MKLKISPSILSADFSRLGEEMAKAKAVGADYIHFDVMDGHFVPNISYGVPVLKSLKKSAPLPFDVHLMITDPYDYIKPFANAGADIITFHVESNSDIKATIDLIHSCGVKAGLTVKPATDISVVYPYLSDIEMVLVMTVEPGFGGQKFMADMLPKCAELREYAEAHDLDYEISVDGGVSADNARMCVLSGANVLVAGSSVLGKPDIKKAAEELLAAANIG